MATLTPELKARFEKEITENPIVIYMKGNQLFPRCGFSGLAVETLKTYGKLYTVDVLAEPDVRDAIKEFSSWPTIPQVYIRGKFVGGSDIVAEMKASGELEKLVKGN